MAVIRGDEELRNCAAVVADELSQDFYSADAKARFSGILATLQWVAGEVVPSPIDQRPGVTPSSQAVEDELANAYDVIYRRRPPSKVVNGSYAGGVEATLLWALGRSDEPPTPLD
ncbi:hypothetical protein [Blastococcus saxobsidens]|uniref:Uncharacterized protein n=1 Tax=Blastococcus saxobsidens TaxID=138336 RepID=A0A4Q7YB32_9ACTN|nr:hypothetical protein [Blastococcus saxobsidens]RZU33411.1 hypothetical protein BKA19_3134 [Blastococcus saxobsidens]